MIEINDKIYFTIELVHSDKKNKDYPALVMHFKNSDDKIILNFITKSLYDNIKEL